MQSVTAGPIVAWKEPADGRDQTTFSGTADRVAIDLPADLGFAPGTLVRVEKIGEEIRITPVAVRADADVTEAEGKARLNELIRRLRKIGPVGEIERREPIEFPDRPGLY